MKKFKKLFMESKVVTVDIACPECFKGNIVSVAKSLGVSVTPKASKYTGSELDTTLTGQTDDVIKLLKKMGVNKDDLQLYIDSWEK